MLGVSYQVNADPLLWGVITQKCDVFICLNLLFYYIMSIILVLDLIKSFNVALVGKCSSYNQSSRNIGLKCWSVLYVLLEYLKPERAAFNVVVLMFCLRILRPVKHVD